MLDKKSFIKGDRVVGTHRLRDQGRGTVISTCPYGKDVQVLWDTHQATPFDGWMWCSLEEVISEDIADLYF